MNKTENVYIQIQRVAKFATLLLLSIISNACEQASSSGGGASVAIPTVVVNCSKGRCLSATTPLILVTYSTSGCADMAYGATVSSSTESVNCNPTSGCYAVMNSWVDGAGHATTTMPSGVYSACARVNYDRLFPDGNHQDSVGELDDVAVGSSTATQTVSSWTDI